jgi:spore coat polysaccharide biosynthesis protein SpsF (cytidylyltransferase family)
MKFSPINFFIKNKISILIIVRLKSKRFKEKAQKSFFGVTLIEILILRLIKIFDRSQIIICTTKLQNNYFFKKIALKYKIKLFLGSDKNIFKRIVDCQRKFRFNHFVRVTGDNPLTDISSLCKLSLNHIKNNNDYTFTKSISIGLRSEVIKIKALRKAYRLAIDPNSSEYMSYFFQNKFFKYELVKFKKFVPFEEKYSITIDYLKDYLLLKKIISSLQEIYLSRKEIVCKLRKFSNKVNISNTFPLKNSIYDVRLKV